MNEDMTAAAHGASPALRAQEKFEYTRGPWQWYGNTKFSYYLATTHSGRQHVMGFQRKGMQYAEPTFRTKHGMKVATHLAIFEVCPEAVNQTDERVYRQDIIGFRSGDASLIAAAPEMYEALLAVNKLIAEAALTGFNCHDGDWADRLYQSQQDTSAALRKARNQPRGLSAAEEPNSSDGVNT